MTFYRTTPKEMLNARKENKIEYLETKLIEEKCIKHM